MRVSGADKLTRIGISRSQGTLTLMLRYQDTSPLHALSPFSPYFILLPLLFLAVSIYFFAFRWYSTSHSKSSVCDTSSVLKKPSATTMSNITPSFPVPLQVIAPVPPPSRELNQRRAVKVPQPYDAFLVLDVEATCLHGSDFQWPNEIIVRSSYRVWMRSHCSFQLQEWPVCLLKWIDKGSNGMASTLQKVAEFRSFVKPTWRPKLTPFCTSLTGITQVSVYDPITVVYHLDALVSMWLGTG